jgi:hypothetical protein
VFGNALGNAAVRAMRNASIAKPSPVAPSKDPEFQSSGMLSMLLDSDHSWFEVAAGNETSGGYQAETTGLGPDTPAATVSPLAPEAVTEALNGLVAVTAKASPVASVSETSAATSSVDTYQPFILTDAVDPAKAPGITPQVIAAAQYRLDHGDRAGAYGEIYLATGNPQLPLVMQITTFSGTPGGAALLGNYLAKVANPDLYNIDLDYFSTEIVQATIDLFARHGNDVTADMIQQTDRGVWRSHGLQDYFPGNIQFLDEVMKSADARSAVISPGARNAIDAATYGGVLGKRPAEYVGNPSYKIVRGSRFDTVIEKSTGNIEAFFDKKLQPAPDIEWAKDFGSRLLQIPDTRVDKNGFVYQMRQHAYEFLQANSPRLQLGMSQTWMKNLPVQSPNIIAGPNGIHKSGWYFNPGAAQWQSYTNFGLFGFTAPIPAQSVQAFNAARTSIINSRVQLQLPPQPLQSGH